MLTTFRKAISRAHRVVGRGGCRTRNSTLVVVGAIHSQHAYHGRASKNDRPLAKGPVDGVCHLVSVLLSEFRGAPFAWRVRSGALALELIQCSGKLAAGRLDPERLLDWQLLDVIEQASRTTMHVSGRSFKESKVHALLRPQ